MKFNKPTFKKPKFKRPELPSLKAAPDPLKGIKPQDDAEADAKEELTALQQGFRDRAKAEAERFADATDTGYFTCVVFANRAQNDAFLKHIGKLHDGDLFIDGRDLAAVMGFELPPGQPGGSSAKIDKDFAKMARKD